MTQLATYLHQKHFCILVEHLTSVTETYPVKNTLAGYPTVMTLADRVHSDDDLSPLEASQNYPEVVEKILHYAGKGRDIRDFERFLDQSKAANIYNLLLLSGDKLQAHSDGQGGTQRTRYLESVNAVMLAKKYAGFQIGVAFNPFKYLEAERDAQYLKLHKKLKAGADFIISQLGYDLEALKQAKAFLEQHGYSQQIFACVMPLSLARAHAMLKNQVAGIVITPHMLKVLAEEKQAGLGDRIYMRCALQILICKQLGFAGIHLSACHKPNEQTRLEGFIRQYQNLDLKNLEQLWTALWQVETGNEFIPNIAIFSRQASIGQIIKYRHLHFMHQILFESKAAKGIGGFIFKAEFWNKQFASKALLKTEWISKHRILDCESCGQCRLADSLYICPETCPKGLANGPCGGTNLDRCEFGDRECIHSVKARLAKAVGQTAILSEKLIPTVALEVRGRSSWKNWYVQTKA